MDIFKIKIKNMNDKLNEFNNLKKDIESLQEEWKGIKSSSTISSLYQSTTDQISRLAKDYNNAFSWLEEYLKSVNETENNLKKFTGKVVSTPIEFKNNFSIEFKERAK